MPSQNQPRAGVFFMLLSVVLFGYFGFFGSWSHQYVGGAVIPMVVVLMWTLRGGSILFAIAAALATLRLTAGVLLYAVAGLATSALFLVVAVWEWTNPNGYFSGVPAIFLVLFAMFNGYGSLGSLMDFVRARRAAANQPESGHWDDGLGP